MAAQVRFNGCSELDIPDSFYFGMGKQPLSEGGNIFIAIEFMKHGDLLAKLKLVIEDSVMETSDTSSRGCGWECNTFTLFSTHTS